MSDDGRFIDYERLVWPLIMLLASFAYLLSELLFNAYLVKNAVTVDPIVLGNLELWGRVVSATGCAIFGIRICRLKWIKGNILIAMIVISGLWCFIFWGQKALLDWYVDSSTESQRLDAWHVNLLKRGISVGAINLQGLDVYSGSGKDKTLLSMLGILAFSDPEYIQILKSSSDDLAASIADSLAVENIESLYSLFIQFREELTVRYQSGIQAQKFAWDYTPVLQREISQFFIERNRCNSEAKPYIHRCFEATDAEFERQISNVIGKPIKWKQFCRPSHAATRYELKFGQVHSSKNDSLNCQNISSETIEKVLLRNLGVVYRFETWQQFSKMPQVQLLLKRQLEVDHDVNPDMTKAVFMEHIVKPRYREIVLAERDRWLNQTVSDEEGSRAVRAVVVHPVAIGFSLFFGILNMVGLISGAGRLLISPTFGHSLTMISLSAIFVVPSLFGVSDSHLYEYLKTARIDELGYVIRWVMAVEPWIYKLFGGFV